MTCDAIARLLVDYLEGSLPAGERAEVESHLAACADCRADVEAWRGLSALPEEQPSPQLAARFQTMLGDFRDREGAVERRGWRRLFARTAGDGIRIGAPALAAAWTLVLLAIGFAAGRYTGRSPEQDTTALHAELTQMRQAAVLAMLQQQLASERLQAVSLSAEQDQPDPAIVAALLHTLQYDPSVDVRLAAVDALGRFARSPDLRQRVAQALMVQGSPLVQVALIDLLVDLKDPAAADALKRFRERTDLLPTVLAHVDQGLRKL